MAPPLWGVRALRARRPPGGTLGARQRKRPGAGRSEQALRA